MHIHVSGLISQYMRNKNVYAHSAVDDFNIRVKDNAFTLSGDPKNKKNYIDHFETIHFQSLTARFVDYCANQTDNPNKKNIQAARKAFYMIKKDPEVWKELGHKILNAGFYSNKYIYDGYHYDESIIEQDIFKELYETKVQYIKKNPAPIWFQVLRSEVRRIAHNLPPLNPFGFLFKKTENNPPPKDHNLTIIGDDYSDLHYVNQLTDYIQSLVDNPEMDNKKIIIAYKSLTLSDEWNGLAKKRGKRFYFHDQIRAFNEARKEKKQPLIELREIDAEYQDIADKNPEIKPENIDIGLALLKKYKDRLEMSKDTEETLDDMKANIKFEKELLLNPILHNYDDERVIIYKILLSNWDKIDKADKKTIYEKVHPLLPPKLSQRLRFYYETQFERIKIASKKGDNNKAQQQFNELMDDPKIKDALHFSYTSISKELAILLLNPENSLANKIEVMSMFIEYTLPGYLRSEAMLGEIREWRLNAKKAMEKHPADSEEYQEAKEMSDAHIVMFTGVSHVVDLKALVDGAKILDNFNPTRNDGRFTVCDKRKKWLI